MAKKTLTTTKETQEVKGSSVIISPLVTEKASLLSNQNAYSFIVQRNATKLTIKEAVTKMYKVTPLSVRTTTIPAQYTYIRGKLGKTSPVKKAIVCLKKGDTIPLA